MTIETHHIYKAYSGSTFIGVIENVISEFEYYQDINTAGTHILMEIAQSADTASQSIEAITDEDGNIITDENSNPITIERQPDLIGLSNSSSMIRNGVKVVVTEISDYYPTGKVVFRGKINKVEASFSDQSKDIISVTVFSDGDEFDNFIIQDGI